MGRREVMRIQPIDFEGEAADRHGLRLDMAVIGGEPGCRQAGLGIVAAGDQSLESPRGAGDGEAEDEHRQAQDGQIGIGSQRSAGDPALARGNAE